MVTTMWFDVEDIYIYEKDDGSVWASLNNPDDEDLTLVAVRTYSSSTVNSILDWDMTIPLRVVDEVKNKYVLK